MAERLILTNNPRTLSSYPTADWINGGPLEVMLQCRRKVHGCYSLLTHPLIGDINLLHNPFRSLLLRENKEEVDPISIAYIEETIERLRVLYRDPRDSNALEDYQTIDFELFQAVARGCS